MPSRALVSRTASRLKQVWSKSISPQSLKISEKNQGGVAVVSGIVKKQFEISRIEFEKYTVHGLRMRKPARALRDEDTPHERLLSSTLLPSSWKRANHPSRVASSASRTGNS